MSVMRFCRNKAAAEARESQRWAQSQIISGEVKKSEQGRSKRWKNAIMYAQVRNTLFVKGMRTSAQGKRSSWRYEQLVSAVISVTESISP